MSASANDPSMALVGSRVSDMNYCVSLSKIRILGLPRGTSSSVIVLPYVFYHICGLPISHLQIQPRNLDHGQR